MPRRVASFFRSPHDSIKTSTSWRISLSSGTDNTVTATEGSTYSFFYTSPSPSPAEGEIASTEHYTCSEGPSTSLVDMLGRGQAKDGRQQQHHHHRLSFPLFLGSHRTAKVQKDSRATLDWRVESPPVVFLQDAESSSGALISGQLLLSVKELPFEVDSLDAKLVLHVVQKKPFHLHCDDCANQITTLQTFKILTGPQTLSAGLHTYPCSTILPGHLPASTDNTLVSIRYEFTAEVCAKVGSKLNLTKTIDVKRALPEADLPHHSVRVFPPTNIAASVRYPQVIHPIGSEKLEFRLEGMVRNVPEKDVVERWKLHRLTWKIEEHLKTVAPACPKHEPRRSDGEEAAKKGVTRTEAKVIGSAEMYDGWKADYSPQGKIEMEVDYQCCPSYKVSCDMKSSDGTEITHQLVLEVVVLQQHAGATRPDQAAGTGLARRLRMHFATVVTERAGLGVSWDNEAPPIYQDVPPSPPSYLPVSPPSYSCDDPDDEVEGIPRLNAQGSTEDLNVRTSTPPDVCQRRNVGN